MRFKDVDKPVTIDAPPTGSGKPIEELGKALEQDFGSGTGGADEEIASRSDRDRSATCSRSGASSTRPRA